MSIDNSVKNAPSATGAQLVGPSFARRAGNYLGRNGLIVGFILIVIVLSLSTPAFMKLSNLINIIRQVSVNGILAVGETFVILLGGIDLSVGSGVALAGVLAAGLQRYGLPLWIVMPAVFVVPILVLSFAGFVNGLVITRFRVPAFVITLGMLTILRGFTFLYTEGRSIYNLPNWFRWLGQGDVNGIPVPIIILVFVAILGYIVLHHTRFGRYVYAIGGNEEGARLSGVRTKTITLWSYVICGAMAGLAGVVLASRLNAGEPVAGQGYELDAIAAVVIGGTSLSGGQGTLIGTMIGALVIGVINNGLNLLNVHSYWQMVAKGVIIVVAVIVDQFKNRH
jgi:ribose/xylose/arabinose/galactoside ABC-type transport system permease subunit